MVSESETQEKSREREKTDVDIDVQGKKNARERKTNQRVYTEKVSVSDVLMTLALINKEKRSSIVWVKLMLVCCLITREIKESESRAISCNTNNNKNADKITYHQRPKITRSQQNICIYPRQVLFQYDCFACAYIDDLFLSKNFDSNHSIPHSFSIRSNVILLTINSCNEISTSLENRKKQNP